MPKWTNDPPKSADVQPFRIIRTPADKPILAIVTCPQVVGCNTHFINNRTIPCEGTDVCPWDAEGHSWRWHGYVSAVLTATLEHVLFEFTAASSDTFKNYDLLHSTLRGCFFQAVRPSRRHNGRVIISCKPSDPQRTRLPDPPVIEKILCHIWGVQYDAMYSKGLVRHPFKDIGVIPGNGDRRERPQTSEASPKNRP